jgi:hypothetical protein
MGDRGNIVIEEDFSDGKIFLYSHWGGSSLPEILANALDRGQGRWSDSPYLTRIIFNEMTKGDEMDTTGFGISTVQCDNEHTLLYVDVRNQQVRTDLGSVPFHDASAENIRAIFR